MKQPRRETAPNRGAETPPVEPRPLHATRPAVPTLPEDREGFLAVLRRRVRETADRQRDGLHYRHPDPATLWSTVDSYRLWERRPGDGDFGVIRVGLGPQTLATPLVPPVTPPMDDLEPMTAGALRPADDEFAALFAEFIVEASGGADEPIDRRVFEIVDGHLVEFSGSATHA